MRRVSSSLCALFAAAALVLPAAARADEWKVDPIHSSAVFSIHHLGAGYVYGLVGGATGTISYDPANPESTKFDVTIELSNINTANAQRDGHLKGPDFFNVKQFPEATFKSTSVKKTGETTMDVTGDFTLHGVTKSITVPMTFTGSGKDMKGQARAGFEANFAIKRSDYGIDKMVGMVGDDVKLMVGLEAGNS